MIYILFFLNAGLLLYSYRTLQVRFLSLGPAFLFFVSAYTWAGLSSATSTLMPFDFIDLSTNESIDAAIRLFFLSSILLILGLLFAQWTTPQKKNKGEKVTAAYATIRKKLLDIKPKYFFLISLLWVVVFSLSYGPGKIISRDVYIPEFAFDGGVKLSIFLLPISSFAIGWTRRLVIRWMLALIYFFIIISVSSRIILVFLAFYFIGSCIRRNKIGGLNTVLVLGLMLLMSSFALEVRNLFPQGIIHNTAYFLSGVDIDTILYTFNYLTSFSVGVLSYAISSPYALDGSNAFIYSINPMPSFLLSPMTESISLLGTAPYSAYAVLYLESGYYFALYFVICGFIFGKACSLFHNRNAYLLSVSCVLFMLFCLYSTQYFLRDVTRILYYQTILITIYYFFTSIRSISRKI